ncbi:(2Fe-2S)-binding protein [Brevibacterium luteolum]|uniref:(2Fe-2S)-binding protein n=1 Tax=Brevibacterium luteolum TaxID=199591 RepID=UPI001585AA33|nr:hypothetical protein [Brevibacterium luteolum]
MDANRDFPICRCEDVFLRDIEGVLQQVGNEVSPAEVKRRLRAGMGWCQARVCGSALSAIIEGRGRLSRSSLVRPVSLSELAGEARSGAV